MQCNVEVELDLRWRKLLKVLAFKIFVTSRMVLFEIHQRFKGHFFKKLHVSFNSLCNIKQKTMLQESRRKTLWLCFTVLYRSNHWRCSIKKVFLKISGVSQENSSVGVLLKTPFFWRKTPFLKNICKWLFLFVLNFLSKY